MLRHLSISIALGVVGAFVSLNALSPVPLAELGGEAARWITMLPAALISAAVGAALCLSYYQPLPNHVEKRGLGSQWLAMPRKTTLARVDRRQRVQSPVWPKIN
jgi:hypothetical protein